MLLYAITDRNSLAGNCGECERILLSLAAQWSAGGVDYIQVREKDLPVAALISLAAGIVRACRQSGGSTQVFVNSRPDSAAGILAGSGANGVHLTGGLSAEQLAAAISLIRRSFAASTPVSVSCHSTEEVSAAASAGATLALFAPVFHKNIPGKGATCGVGLDLLAAACRAGHQGAAERALPVLALGGVTVENANQCAAAGAAGVASIRLFLGEGWRRLRETNP
ncbi:Thiamin-phosphate pyrophosphorylase [Acidisarcina polymorpha]|uniref:Thiamin-phosphate pyrophosphorylase n=1 Tax=Acidisarcina polymorpha TaxID=2211140 RepID=A0A2Z5FX51_9BACT|nr:thiamine phosphate synthase [Acidisarcina polymorpha]AXC11300.1 Thiamin-phosphate pyrophosphorylase [Acidisarcina polymorpha]